MRSTDESTTIATTTTTNTNRSDNHDDHDEGCDRDKIRKNFLLAAFMWYFICGIEYSLILSSVESYVSSISASSYFGYCLASFSLSGLIFAPMFGRLADRTKSIRNSMFMGIFFSILGNLIYSLFPKKNAIVTGRFLAGIGNAIDGPVLGYAGRVNTKSSRASTFALLLVIKQIGTISVPLWQVVIRKTFENVSPIRNPFYPSISISSEAFYGLALAFLWILCLFCCIYLLLDEEKLLANPNDGAEEARLVAVEEVSSDQTPVEPDPYAKFIPEYINEPFVVALFATFSAIILQASMEAMGPPFYRSYFGWGKKEIGLVFMGVAICAILGYSFMKFVSQQVETPEGELKMRIETRTTFIFGVCSCFLVGIMTSILIVNASFDAIWLKIGIFGIIIVFCFSLPLLGVSSAAIIARNTPEKFQSSAQSLRFISEKIAQILSPIWVNNLTPASTNGPNGILIMLPSNILFALSLGIIYLSRKFLNIQR